MKNLLNNVLLSLVLLVISVCLSNSLRGQSLNDSVEVKKHSPKKATWLSLFPGAGQIYNKKYWKLPIVYAGFGVTGYYAFWNRAEYLKYNEAYVCKINEVDEGDCQMELALKYDEEKLKTFRDYYRRNMELSFILMGVWYVLQILDATVDAHLYYWNVDENLSVRLEPIIQQPIFAPSPNIPNRNISHNGLKISVNF